MALILLQPGIEPIGQYDAADGYVTTTLGGEVCMFGTVTVASDKAAADAQDGYLNPGTSRVALTTNLTDSQGLYMLVDDGTANYGTLLGTIVGGTDGQVADGGYGPNGHIGSGTVVGPHTAFGSGKWTAWDKPGLYGVTLDALDARSGGSSTSYGIQPANASAVPGAALYAALGAQTTLTAGFLTLGGGVTHTTAVIARFVEFRTKGSLVSTPNRLVSALNSPSSTVSGVLANSMFMAVVHLQVGA